MPGWSEFFAFIRIAESDRDTMASFNMIRTDDPSQYHDQIVRLWKENLPGTPPERFDWMQAGNPAGAAIWFLAFEEASDEIAGALTIMPRRIYYRGRETLAGILGDFMVDSKYRVFGPNLMLVRAPLKSLDELGLSFIYTLPNESSRKMAERAGVRYTTELSCYTRPLDFRTYIEKRLPATLAEILSPAVGFLFRLSSAETWLSFDGTVEETVDIDEGFDRFWERLREESPSIIGDRSAVYLRWRYQSNPLYHFRFLTCRRKGERDISGYTVFCGREEDRIEIYDLQASSKGCFNRLVKALTDIGRKERARSIYFIAPRWSTMLDRLRRFRFLDTKSTHQIGFFGEPDLPLEEWDFVSGERNI